VHAYLTATLRGLGCEPLRVGWPRRSCPHPCRAIEKDLPSRIGQKSQNQLNQIVKSKGNSHFSWQSGYGAFSVSQSAKESVISYIARQESHHRRMTFQQEFRSLLDKHGIAFDERYVWD
jgi:putative transposase